MAEETIRERIKEYQGEILKGGLMPQRAAEILTEIASLLGNISEEITKQEMAYNKVLLGYFDTEQTANRAKIKADTTPEFLAMKTAKNTEKQAISLIGSLKYFLKVWEREYQNN